MKNYTGILLAAIVLGSGWGCAPEGEPQTLWVYANQLVNRKTQCTAKSTGGKVAEIMPNGIMDILVTNRYVMYPAVKNGLTPQVQSLGQDETTMHLESNVIQLKGGWVTYRLQGLLGQFGTDDGDGGLVETKLPKQWVGTSGAVEPGTILPAQIELVPPPVGALLDNDVAFDGRGSAGWLSATLVMEGTMTDGTVVQSPEFHYSVKVCRGCMVAYDVWPSECCKFLSSPAIYPCFPGQDEPYSCLLGCWLNSFASDERSILKRAMLAGYVNTLATTVEEENLPDSLLYFDKPEPEAESEEPEG